MKKIVSIIAIACSLSLLAGCTAGERRDAGMVAGGVAGGLAGSALSGGNTAATVGGAVGGAYIGRKLAD